MKPKILVISDYRDFHSVRPEAEIFIGLARRGYEVHIMTYGESAYVPLFREAGIRVVDFHPRRKRSRAEIAVIREALVRERYGAMHLFNSRAIQSGLAAARGLPIRVILYRGYTGHVHWYDPTAWFKYLHPRVDRIVCNSAGVKAMFDRQWFFDRSKAVVINKGHRLEWYRDIVPAAVREANDIPAGALLLVSVANNRPMKGVPWLLRAMTLLPAEADIHLLLIGRHMDTPGNLRLLREMPRPERVHFLGFRSDVLAVVAACDAFVLASVKGESITKSVLEAMSLGVAPVITDIPGNSELVEDGVNGIVVPARDAIALRDAILTLYRDRELCRRYGERSKERIATRLHAEQTIDGYEAMYRGLW